LFVALHVCLQLYIALVSRAPPAPDQFSYYLACQSDFLNNVLNCVFIIYCLHKLCWSDKLSLYERSEAHGDALHAPAKPKLLDCNMKDISLHTSCSTRTPRLSKKKKNGAKHGGFEY